MAIHEISEEIRSNFHLFWDNFPFPVMLVHRDRTIVAVNSSAEAIGYPVGIRCCDMGEKKFHAGCRANMALREQAGVREVAYYEHLGQVIDGYWIPLSGVADLYVHFGIDITEHAADRLFPEKCGDTRSGCSCG